MLLKLENIALSIGGRPILKDVSLEIARGQVYGLLGPNGAGKSTTIAAALGLLSVSSGSVRLFDQDPAAPHAETLRRRVGVMPEQNGLYEWMTGEAYLEFFAKLYGLAMQPSAVRSKLTEVGLSAANGRAISTYSRGMKQRLALARALLARPDLLVLDEPTNGLDPRGRRDIHDIFIELAQRGTAILLCTHLLDDVERLCSHIGILVDGRTVTQGRMSELLAQHGENHRYWLRLATPLAEQNTTPALPLQILAREGDRVLVDVTAGSTPDEAWREAMFRGWTITEIERVGGGLEDLYLALTAEGHEQERRAA